MQLNHVHIFNFRSIDSLKIYFDPPCKILVGINESGKSNILKALSLLDPITEPLPGDVRMHVKNELPVKDSFVNFVFDLSTSERDSVFGNVSNFILAKNNAAPIYEYNSKQYSLKAFCDVFKKQGLYKVNVIKKKKNAAYWALKDGKCLSAWKKPSVKCPADFGVEGNEYLLVDFVLINALDYPDIPEEYLEEVTVEYINELIGTKISDLVIEKLPSVVFWTYDEKIYCHLQLV